VANFDLDKGDSVSVIGCGVSLIVQREIASFLAMTKGRVCPKE
jgi:ABC-type iron transport system FetAB ATPase subunit